MINSISETKSKFRMSVIGVPVKVLHEAEGHIVTVETTTGEVRAIVSKYQPYILSLYRSTEAS